MKLFYLIIIYLFIICPSFVLSQGNLFISSDSLDEIVLDGKYYNEKYYFVFWKSNDALNYPTYEPYLVRFDLLLQPEDTAVFFSINSKKIFPIKLLIANDTIFIAGSATDTISNSHNFFIMKITLDFNFSDCWFFGDGIRDYFLTDFIINRNGNFVLCGNSKNNSSPNNTTLFECSKKGNLLHSYIDFDSDMTKPSVLQVEASGKYHVHSDIDLLILNEDFSEDTNYMPEFYNRFKFKNYLISYNNLNYFLGGDEEQIYKKQNRSILEKDEEYWEIQYYLVDSSVTPLDSGFIKLPNMNDHIGGFSFTTPNTLAISGTHNYFVDYPVFFEEQFRWVVLQSLNLDSKQVNWFFEYGGDANYFVEGMFKNELSGNYIVYATRYDWPHIERKQRDIFLMEIDTMGQLVGINKNKLPNKGIVNIGPNPGKDLINIISSESNPEAIFKLFNIQGILILQKTLNNNKTSISTFDLNPGLYIYTIEKTNGNGIVFCGKWIKK